MNKDIAYILRHPPTPCPVTPPPLAVQDLSLDGIETYALLISLADFSATRYKDIERVQIAQWLTEYLLPELNKYAKVYLSKVDYSLYDSEGEAGFE